MSKTDDRTVGTRWYLDGRPGAVYSDPAPTGFFSFHFDGEGFASNMNMNDEHDWVPCDETEVELAHERARITLAKMGIKI